MAVACGRNHVWERDLLELDGGLPMCRWQRAFTPYCPGAVGHKQQLLCRSRVLDTMMRSPPQLQRIFDLFESRFYRVGFIVGSTE